MYKMEQLLKNKLTDSFGKDRNISLYLYKLAGKLDSLDSDKISETILNRFNSNSNAIKRTYRNRCDTFDDISLSIIKQESFIDFSIHDMAISDGRASVYLLKLLNNNFSNFAYGGSDLAVRYNLFKPKKDSIEYFVTDEDGRIIEITSPPFVWNFARQEGVFYFINNFLKNKAKRRFSALSKLSLLKEEILLADQEFLTLVNSSVNFKLFNHDLMQTIDSTYSVARVMNILHFGYFDSATLTAIIGEIYSSVCMGGLFIEGSNENAGSPVEGAIYRKTEKGFDLILCPEKQSRIIELVLAFKPKNI